MNRTPVKILEKNKAPHITEQSLHENYGTLQGVDYTTSPLACVELLSVFQLLHDLTSEKSSKVVKYFSPSVWCLQRQHGKGICNESNTS